MTVPSHDATGTAHHRGPYPRSFSHGMEVREPGPFPGDVTGPARAALRRILTGIRDGHHSPDRWVRDLAGHRSVLGHETVDELTGVIADAARAGSWARCAEQVRGTLTRL